MSSSDITSLSCIAASEPFGSIEVPELPKKTGNALENKMMRSMFPHEQKVILPIKRDTYLGPYISIGAYEIIWVFP
jgi:hypothetical protein